MTMKASIRGESVREAETRLGKTERRRLNGREDFSICHVLALCQHRKWLLEIKEALSEIMSKPTTGGKISRVATF